MPLVGHIYARVRMGVVHLIFERDGARIAAGSGFILRGKLVTNHHVFFCPEADLVRIRFSSGAISTEEEISMVYSDFCACLEIGVGEDSLDFAILDVPELRKRDLFSFDFEMTERPDRGKEYILLGYPLDHDNLTIHQCMVSSLYTRNGASVIQLDGSVNNGNSGGPLINPSSQGVVGIVTRKNAGLSKTFSKTKGAISGSIKALEAMQESETEREGVAREILGKLIESQRHLKSLCRELERSANSGIAYAFDIQPVFDWMKRQADEALAAAQPPGN